MSAYTTNFEDCCYIYVLTISKMYLGAVLLIGTTLFFVKMSKSFIYLHKLPLIKYDVSYYLSTKTL